MRRQEPGSATEKPASGTLFTTNPPKGARVLRFIVFGCGAALMGLEMVAARVLAPYLGNSIYVWGAVISVVMIALSMGYALGGQLADRFGAARSLPPVIAAAGIATAAAPLVAEAVLPWAANLGPRLGSLAAATAIYFIPSILLAMVSPLGVRLAAREGMAHLGRSTGNLYAVSTGGSIAGTLATSFWLIPMLSLEPLVTWTGISLLAMALLALALKPETMVGTISPLSARLAKVVVPGTLVLAVAGVALSGMVLLRYSEIPEMNEHGETVLFQADTQYHRITVTEGDGARHLRFDRSHQSAISLDDPFESRIRYPDYMHLALALHPEPERVLVLGLGGGAITKRYWRDYPGVLVDSVEIDPVVVDVARDYFSLPEDERTRVFTQDARRFVQESDDVYDIVIVDAYYSDSLPFHLTTDEFLREVKAVMAPDGVLAYNVISAPEGEKSDLFRSMYRTAQGVWGDLWVFPIGLGEDSNTLALRNIIVLATDAPVTEQELRTAISSRVDGRVTINGFAEMGNDLYTAPVAVSDVPLLTDAHAPTDSLIKVQ
ncbi:MAG TPA: spermine synthase [Coriobacteriia bacterium]|nr:MAG: Spermine synthase [Actinobacteria bacterium 66_15]HAL29237.1 spermine synthase [Coriobacteriia bacterium]